MCLLIMLIVLLIVLLLNSSVVGFFSILIWLVRNGLMLVVWLVLIVEVFMLFMLLESIVMCGFFCLWMIG